MQFFIGAIGAVCVLLLFAAGVFLGWKLRGMDEKRKIRKTAAELSAQDLQLMKDQQEAFRMMQNYTPEMAYGYKIGEDLGGEHA